MRLRFASAVAVLPILAFLAFIAAAAPAAGADEPEPLVACGATFNQCMARCEMSYREDEAGKAGCQAACAADRAVCEAKAGYEAAKPWVAEQFRNMQRFLEGFAEKGGDEPQSSPPGDPRFDPRDPDDGGDVSADPDAPYEDI